MLGVALLIVAAAAAAATGLDRLLATIALKQIARRVSALTGASCPPVVSFAGRAFLPQLLVGVYREVRVALAACTAGGIEFRALTARLAGVRAPLPSLLRGRGLVVGQVTAQATIPLSAIAARLPPGLALSRRGDELRVGGSVPFMRATGTLAITADGQQISVVPRLLGVPGLVGFVFRLPGLPRELTIDAVRVTDAGLEITLRGDEVKLPPR